MNARSELSRVQVAVSQPLFQLRVASQLNRCYTLKLLAETLCAMALRNKFQQALHRVTWSVSGNFF